METIKELPSWITADDLTALGFRPCERTAGRWVRGSISLGAIDDKTLGLTLYASPVSREAVAHTAVYGFFDLQQAIDSAGSMQEKSRQHLTH